MWLHSLKNQALFLNVLTRKRRLCQINGTDQRCRIWNESWFHSNVTGPNTRHYQNNVFNNWHVSFNIISLLNQEGAVYLRRCWRLIQHNPCIYLSLPTYPSTYPPAYLLTLPVYLTRYWYLVKNATSMRSEADNACRWRKQRVRRKAKVAFRHVRSMRWNVRNHAPVGGKRARSFSLTRELRRENRRN